MRRVTGSFDSLHSYVEIQEGSGYRFVKVDKADRIVVEKLMLTRLCISQPNHIWIKAPHTPNTFLSSEHSLCWTKFTASVCSANFEGRKTFRILVQFST